MTSVSFWTDSWKMLEGVFGLFQRNRPLHLLKGEERGIDINMVIDACRRRLGITPRLIFPADLRLVPDPESEGGHRLCCLVQRDGVNPHPVETTMITGEGEIVEEIHQVGLELHQHELAALNPEILRQISLRCFNDLRTILLVHDKRMLGVVRQELPSLAARGVLTPVQAKVLAAGIAHTVLAGSGEMAQLLRDSANSEDLKDKYIIKPARGGKGVGIVFGEDLTSDEWVSALVRLQTPELISGTTSVVQRRVVPRLYDLVLKPSGERQRYPLVGTFHIVDGRYLGLGIWRASGSRICAVSTGGSWMCTVVAKDEGGMRPSLYQWNSGFMRWAQSWSKYFSSR